MTRRLIVLFFLLALTALACSLPTQATQPQPTHIPPSTQDVEALKNEVATASARLAETGQLSITFTEQQLTALVITALATQKDLELTDPQVSLPDGQIQLDAKVLFAKKYVAIQIVLVPTVQNAKVEMSIASANFGIIPVPEKLLTQVTELVNKNLSEQLRVNEREIDVESVDISGGMMKITGKAR